MHKFLKFIFGIKLYMFRTGILSIIRSLALYTHHYVYVTQVMLLASRILLASSITCMYCCAYSARLLMMDRKPVRKM